MQIAFGPVVAADRIKAGGLAMLDDFPRVADDRSLWTLGVRLLATLPIDPAIVGNGRGPLLVSAPESEQAERFRALAGEVAAALN